MMELINGVDKRYRNNDRMELINDTEIMRGWRLINDTEIMMGWSC